MGNTDMFSLDGKVAFIPGGSGAIGSALGAGLCEAGAQIAIVDRDGDGLARTCSRMRSEGKDYIVKDGDIILFRFNL